MCEQLFPEQPPPVGAEAAVWEWALIIPHNRINMNQSQKSRSPKTNQSILHANDGGDSMKRILLAVLLFGGWVQAQTGPIPATFFGQTLINPGSDYPNVAIGNMGKGSATGWPYIEPNAPVGGVHSYNWSTLDSYVAQATINHSAVFQYTWDEAPPWATGGSGCNGGSPNQCTGIITDTASLNAFIVALLTRYDGAHGHGLISAWEINNENDFLNITCSTNSGSAINSFAAQTDLMVKDVKAVRPNMLIVGPGFTSVETCYASGQEFDGWWAAWGAIPGNSRHLDAVTFHGYVHTSEPYPEYVIGGPGTTESPCNAGSAPCVKRAMARMGIPSTTPIWDTEGSWGLNSAVSLTSQQQVAFVGRFMLLNWAAGVARQNWYSWDNSQWGTACCAINANGVAYQQVYNWMIGATMSAPCAIQSSTVWTCMLTRSGGYQALAVWNTVGSSSYAVPAGYTDYKNLAGNQTSTTAGSVITIGIQPLLLEGAGATATAPSAPTGLTATVN